MDTTDPKTPRWPWSTSDKHPPVTTTVMNTNTIQHAGDLRFRELIPDISSPERGTKKSVQSLLKEKQLSCLLDDSIQCSRCPEYDSCSYSDRAAARVSVGLPVILGSVMFLALVLYLIFR
jgi:hypothetical protein